MKHINIQAGKVTVKAELNDSPTSKMIWDSLPITGHANTWGDEIYFEIPVIVDQEADARADVEVGELGYWPVGHAFCIFFGPTPVSRGEKPRAYSPVNILGKVLDDPKLFSQVHQGDPVKLERLAAPLASC
jgi:hypothetical protein